MDWLDKIKEKFWESHWENHLQRFLIFLVLIYVFVYHLLSAILEGTDLSPFFESQKFIYQAIYWPSILVLWIYLAQIWNKLSIIKLLLAYLVYSIISYFLLITRNVNNPDFKLTAFSQNHFWQTDGLLPLAIIVAGAVVMKYLMDNFVEQDAITEFISEYTPTISILNWLPSLFVITDERVVSILKSNVSSFINTQEFTNLLKYIFPTLIMIMLVTGAIAALSYRAIRGILKNRSSFSLAVVTSALVAVALNYCLQLGIAEETQLLNRYIFPAATIYQILFLAFFALVIYVLVNRYVIATIIVIILSISLAVANSMKYQLRNEPLLVTDFTWLSDPKQLLEFANNPRLIYVILAFVVLVGLAIMFRKHILPNRIIETLKRRLIVSVALLGIAGFTVMVFNTEEDHKFVDGVPILTQLNNSANTDWFGFTTNAQFKSLSYVWTKQLTKSVMEKPSGYNQKAMENLIKKYEKRASEINKSRKETISDQTVIYVLSESLSDPSRIDGITTSEDVFDNIRTIKSKTTSGLMKSDGYGGGTANMEFQTLTGLPYYNFSPSTSVLMTEVFPKMNYVPSISNLFDPSGRIVIHPSSAKNYNRNKVYEDLEFNKKIFLADSEYPIEHLALYGNNVSDKTTYQNILDNLDEKSNQFLSVITMQNHASWVAKEPANITAKGVGLNDSELESLNSYVKMLDTTDKVTKDFLDSLNKLDKKVTVVFYGDHLPGLYPNSVFENNPDSQYQTDYFIWSNYKTDKKDYPLVNSSDFTAELLAHTNSKVSPYYALLTDILDKASVDKKELTKEQQETADDLKLVQYDLTLGNGYLTKNSESFFNIGE